MSQHRSLLKRRVTKKKIKKYVYPHILGSNGLNIRPKLLVETIEHIKNGQNGGLYNLLFKYFWDRESEEEDQVLIALWDYPSKAAPEQTDHWADRD